MDLSSHLGGRVTVRQGCVHLCPKSSFIHVCYRIASIRRGFQNTVCASLMQTNQAGWLFIAQNVFFKITFKPRLSLRVFLQRRLATSVHDEVAACKMYQPLRGKMSVFLIAEKIRCIPPGRKIKTV